MKTIAILILTFAMSSQFCIAQVPTPFNHYYHENYQETAYTNSTVQTPNGEYISASLVREQLGYLGFVDMHLSSVSEDGITVNWSKRYGQTGVNEAAISLVNSYNGLSTMVAGWEEVGAGGTRGVIMSVDNASGSTNWIKKVGSFGTVFHPTQIIQTDPLQDEYLMVGMIKSGGSFSRIYAVEITGSGTVNWEREYVINLSGSGQLKVDQPKVVYTGNDKAIVACTFDAFDAIYTMEIDLAAFGVSNLQFMNYVDNSTSLRSIIQDGAGDFVLSFNGDVNGAYSRLGIQKLPTNRSAPLWTNYYQETMSSYNHSGAIAEGGSGYMIAITNNYGTPPIPINPDPTIRVPGMLEINVNGLVVAHSIFYMRDYFGTADMIPVNLGFLIKGYLHHWSDNIWGWTYTISNPAGVMCEEPRAVNVTQPNVFPLTPIVVENDFVTATGLALPLKHIPGAVEDCGGNFFGFYRKGNSTIEDIKVKNEGIHLYPNPTSNYLNISFEGDPIQLQILNVNGQIVFQQDNVTSNQEINIESLPSGTYYIRSTVEGTMLSMEKLIIMQ